METITKIATFMHTADKAFWHEKIATNRYLATLSVLFALFAGIVTPEAHRGVRQWLADSFLEWGIFSSLLAAIGVLFMLVVLNIGGVMYNIGLATLGNSVGGAILVGMIYWVAYRAKKNA